MAFIYLTEGGQSRGQFDLPSYIDGDGGGSFRLGKSRSATRHGVVFEADCTRAVRGMKGLCAVKVLAQQDDVRYDRFQNELRIMRMLDHKYIAKFLDSGEFPFDGGVSSALACNGVGRQKPTSTGCRCWRLQSELIDTSKHTDLRGVRACAFKRDNPPGHQTGKFHYAWVGDQDDRFRNRKTQRGRRFN